LYDTTSISGKNRSGKSNILYAIVNILLGTNLSGDEKSCLINQKVDSSYGELHFTDNQGIKHILVRIKNRVGTKNNSLTLDGKSITQNELISFYKDKKLFLSIINPLYFLSKKPAEQKEMVDKYLSDIKPMEIFKTLNDLQQQTLLNRYFRIPVREIYDKLDENELKELYSLNKLQEITNKKYEELSQKELFTSFKDVVLKDIKYYYMLSQKEQEEFVNTHILNIFMDIAYNNLSQEEQKLLEGIPQDIPTYISELNQDIKKAESYITSLNSKIDYAQNIADEKLPEARKFEKEVELSLSYQELDSLSNDKRIKDKENQKKKVEDLEKEILNLSTEITELEKKMKSGKQKYLAIKNGLNNLCPTCEQHIQNEAKEKTIANMKKDLTDAFNRKNTLEAKEKDLKFKLAMEKCQYHALGGDTSIDNTKKVANINENIKALEKEQKEIERFNNEIAVKQKNIQNAKRDISNFNKQISIQNKYISDLKDARKVAQKLYIGYIEEKMKLAKHYLKNVKVQFYSVLKTTGEIKDDFVITYKGNLLSNLSRSETIATALEFANMFNQIAKTKFPIFVDDMESCADYDFIKAYASNSQIIVSNVVKGSNLKIEDYYNNEDCTIIKHVIANAKTINIYNKNNTAIPKAA
jgi:ATPase involved in DNA repair